MSELLINTAAFSMMILCAAENLTSIRGIEGLYTIVNIMGYCRIACGIDSVDGDSTAQSLEF